MLAGDDSIMSEEQAAKRHTDSWTSKGPFSLFIICIHASAIYYHGVYSIFVFDFVTAVFLMELESFFSNDESQDGK